LEGVLNLNRSEIVQGELHRVISVVFRKLTIFIIPAAILAAAGLGLPHLAELPPAWGVLFPYLPSLIIMSGILLSFHFRRGRVFSVLLMLAALAWPFHPWQQNGPQGSAFLTVQLFAFLLPVNITLFCFMRERGALTSAGRMRLAFLLLQWGWATWLVRARPEGVARFLARELIHLQFPRSVALSQSVLLVFFAGFLLIAVRIVRRQSPVDSALLGTMVAAAAVCNWPTVPDLPLVFIAAAALILTLSVLQDSYNMAFRDDLTGLPSRRALNEQLTGLGRRYVLAMLDVDHFKSFNDTYGHDVGDQVLKMVARKIQGVKGGGKPFRYGGEEFTVCFPRRRLAEAIPHLEEVRKSIAAYELRLRGSDRPEKTREGKKQRGAGEGGEAVSVTISIGVSESGDRLTPVEVLKAADEALYRAKRKGRNQLSK
jgi:diguanylate cyclase (GGDEF)-like protein